MLGSALQKAIRGGDERAAVYWALELQGIAPYYVWKRVLVIAAEDIGLAAPEVVGQVCTLQQAWAACKERSYYVSNHHLTMAVMLLCRAPKSTEVEDLQSLTIELQKQGKRREVPPYVYDGHTKVGKAAKVPWTVWYDARHFILRVPTNAYTAMLAKLVPAWFSEQLQKRLAKEHPEVDPLEGVA